MKTCLLYCGPFCRFVCVMLAIVMATGPSAAAVAQQPVDEPPIVEHPTADQPLRTAPGLNRVSGDTTLLATPEAGKIDLTYVPPQAVFLAVAHPAQLLRAPGAEMLPIEVITAAGLAHLGFDPADVREVMVFVEPPMGFEPRLGMVVKFLEPFDGAKLPEKLRGHTQPGELAGRRYLQSVNPQLPSLYMPNDRTLLVAPDASLRQMLAVNELEQTSPLFDRIRDVAGVSELYAVVDIASLRPIITPLVNMAVMQQGEKFPEEAKPFLEAPNLISAVELTINLMSAGPNSLVVHAGDAANADRLEGLIDLASQLQRRSMEVQMAKLAESEDPIERALAQYMQRMSQASAESFRPMREGNSLILFRVTGTEPDQQQALVKVAVIGILVALLLPAVQAAREAARRNQSMNNMKQLMLALHNYADAHKSFPAHASYDAEGKPLLSWRVHILPFIGKGELYKEFHRDEPWDSPHNKQLIARMPEVYRNPNLLADDGTTNYLAIVGEECIFNGTADGMRLANITDGTSKTIMLVEADLDEAVIWTKPDDLAYNADNPAAGFGRLRPTGALVAIADGSVRFISEDIDPQTLKALFTRAGGETIQTP